MNIQEMDFAALVRKAKYLKECWDKCTTDVERLHLAMKYKNDFLFTLDNDNTSVTIRVDDNTLTNSQQDEIFELFGVKYLEDDFGNRSGVGVLLGIIGLKWEYC